MQESDKRLPSSVVLREILCCGAQRCTMRIQRNNKDTTAGRIVLYVPPGTL